MDRDVVKDGSFLGCERIVVDEKLKWWWWLLLKLALVVVVGVTTVVRLMSVCLAFFFNWLFC